MNGDELQAIKELFDAKLDPIHDDLKELKLEVKSIGNDNIRQEMEIKQLKESKPGTKCSLHDEKIQKNKEAIAEIKTGWNLFKIITRILGGALISGVLVRIIWIVIMKKYGIK